MKNLILVSALLMVGCSSIPPEVRQFIPEMSYSVDASSDPFGIISKGLQAFQTATGQPCPTANNKTRYRNDTDKGLSYKVDCTK